MEHEQARGSSRPYRRRPWYVVHERELAEEVARLLPDRIATAGDLDLAFGDREELPSRLPFPYHHGVGRHVDDVRCPHEQVEALPWKNGEQGDAPKLSALWIAPAPARFP